jgi:hypothetical protein
VVDEAQDLRPAHWKMPRAMTAPDRNDLFLVGDARQSRVLGGETYGDLHGGGETPAGYRSVPNGAVPDLHRLGGGSRAGGDRRADRILGPGAHEQIATAIAITVPTNDMASEVATRPRTRLEASETTNYR